MKAETIVIKFKDRIEVYGNEYSLSIIDVESLYMDTNEINDFLDSTTGGEEPIATYKVK